MFMAISLKIKSTDGQETLKVLEEITSDAEESQREFLFEKSGLNAKSCLWEAISDYNGITEFVNEVNYYRIFKPNPRYAKTHPTIVKFYR